MQVLRLQVKYTGKRLPIYFPKGGRNMAASDYTSLVQQFYVGFYGRPADAAGLAYWSERVDFFNGDFTSVLNAFATSAEADEYVYTDPDTGDKYTNTELVENVYQDLFGRAADAAGLEWYVGKLDSGEYTVQDVVKRVIDGAQGDDSTVLANKVKVAEYFTDNLGDATYGSDEITEARAVLSGVEADDASVLDALDLADSTIEDMGGGAGQTFTLTKDVELVTGTTGNDTIRGVVTSATDSDNTLNQLDEIDGGAGTDTLKISNSFAAAINMPIMSDVEVVELSSTDMARIDTSSYTDVTDLNIVKVGAAKTIDATAADTTDISVDLKAVGNTVDTDGGNNVTVKLTDVTAADVVTVGAAAASGAAGDVVVETTGGKYVAATASTLSNINVNGGKTISVTQSATSDDSAAAADKVAATITQGDVTIDASAVTTTVTVKQDAAVAANNAVDTTGGVTETASVKFGAIKAGDVLTLDPDGAGAAANLVFTAAKDMTAADVAAAFANLVNDAAKGTLPPGDTQSGGAYTDGTYSGNSSLWTSAAASGDTVVFTSTTANFDVADLAITLAGAGTAPVVTTTAGKANDATPEGGVAGITAGVVDITNGAAMKTVTVDGFSAAGSNINGANTVLETLTLKNGGAFTTSNAATTLALTLEGISGTYTQTAGAKTLNITSTGNNTADLDIATTETLTVDGTGTITANGGVSDITAVKTITVTGDAGINLGTAGATTALTSVDTSGTTGAVTLGIDDGTQTSYTGGEGVDSLTIENAGTAITKAIDLGNGNDTLTLVGATVVVPTAALKGGDGTDTLSIDAASAAALDGATTFSAKLTGFETLEVTGAAGGETIDVKNLGFADSVILAGSVGATAFSNFANNADLVINADVTTSVTASIKDDATGTADVLNVELSKDGVLAASDLIATNIETVNLTVTDTVTTNGISTHTMNFDSAKATSLDVDGNAGLTLTLDANTVKLATIDASGMTDGGLTVAANGANVMTITGGDGADVLTASATKADVLNGGEGADVLTAGFNGALLTGGEGNDLFVVGASTAAGNQEANTYSKILDFQAGDKIQLSYWETSVPASTVVDSFAKLAASLDESTATFTNFVNAAFQEMTSAGDAVWFMYKGDSYIVIDSNASAAAYAPQTGFTDGEDLIVRVEDVDLTGVSFNDTYGTIEMA
jgi:S-layer protein